jgi:hypothetical protein
MCSIESNVLSVNDWHDVSGSPKFRRRCKGFSPIISYPSIFMTSELIQASSQSFVEVFGLPQN